MVAVSKTRTFNLLLGWMIVKLFTYFHCTKWSKTLSWVTIKYKILIEIFDPIRQCLFISVLLLTGRNTVDKKRGDRKSTIIFQSSTSVQGSNWYCRVPISRPLIFEIKIVWLPTKFKLAARLLVSQYKEHTSQRVKFVSFGAPVDANRDTK